MWLMKYIMMFAFILIFYALDIPALAIFCVIPLCIFAYYDFFANRTTAFIDKSDELSNSEINAKLKDISKNEDTDVLAANTPSGLKFFISEQDRASVIGPPGTGKTTFLVNQLKHWIKTGKSFVCLDIKPEIAALTKIYLEELRL